MFYILSMFKERYHSMIENRWIVALSAALIHICVGSVYAYSVMSNPVASVLNTTPNQVTVSFTIAIVILGTFSAMMWCMPQRPDSRIIARLAAIFFGISIFGSGIAIRIESIYAFYFFYGFLGGIGLGLAYSTPVTVLVKWFPNNKGLAAGIAIMCFGFSSLIFGPVMARLFIDTSINTGTYYSIESVSRTFFILGSLYFIIMFIASFFLASPNNGANNIIDNKNQSLTIYLKDKKYWYIFFMLFINIMCGITVISMASPMVQYMLGYDELMAASLVGVIGLFNGLGRIFWSTISDYTGRSNAYMIYSIIQIAGFFTIAFTSNAIIYQIMIYLIFSCYGAGFATIVSLLSDVFGNARISDLHGVTLLAWSFSAVVGPLGASYLQSNVLEGGGYSLILMSFGFLFIIQLILNILLRLDWYKNKSQYCE